MKIVRAEKQDIMGIGRVARQSFSVWKNKEEKESEKWIECAMTGYPKSQYFIAKKDDKVLGFILWVEKGGFRKESVWEMEQIAVNPEHRGQGIATELIKQSLAEIKNHVQERGDKIKLIEITTGTHQNAQRLYTKTLNAKPEAMLKDIFRGDEVIMIARKFKN